MKINKQKIGNVLKYIGIFAMYFLVQYRFLNVEWFATDELDVMAGGKAIACGYQLYGDFISQHMPFSYYLSALFDALGATSVVGQRIAFYLFYAFMWTVIYGRYHKKVNKYALLLYPICFSGLITCYDMGTVVLSEHLAGIGFVILFLEFIVFYKERKLNVGNYIAISIAVILTFGTIFISIFAVFVIAVGVLIREIQWQVKEKKKFSVFLKEMLKKYVPLGCWVGAPWVLLAFYYSLKDNFKMAVYSAYTVNREIYPKYNGFGESISKTMLGCVDNFFGMVKSLLKFETMNVVTVVQLLVIVAIVAFVINIFTKKEYLLGAVVICYLLEMGVRGYFCFHGTQWVEVASLIVTMVLFDILIGTKEAFTRRSLGYRTAVVVCALIVGSTTFGDISNVTDRSFTEEDEDEKLEDNEKMTRDIIEAITDEKEAVWQLSFFNYVTMTADRPTIQNVGATPWMYEALGLHALTIFEDDPPRVAIYYEGHECWGYTLTTYAPDLVLFMQKHYTQLEGTQIYIRNDYYEEACDLIQEAHIAY